MDGKYFLPRNLHECNSLIPNLEEIIKDYKEVLEHWRRSSYTKALSEALYTSIDASDKLGVNSKRDDIWRKAYDAAKPHAVEAARAAILGNGLYGRTIGAFLHAFSNKARKAAEDFAFAVANYEAWEFVKAEFAKQRWAENNPFEKNPYEKICQLFHMGLYPRGFRLVDDEEKFVVDFPRPHKVDLWVEGDEEISHKHRWGDLEHLEPIYCSKSYSKRENAPMRKIEDI